MTVSLARAWEICAALDEADAERSERELARAVSMTASTTGKPPSQRGWETRRAASR